MKAMILAAGAGTRLGSVTVSLPKPMVPVLGLPLLEHTISALSRQGVRDLVINLHHCPEAIPGHFGDGTQWGVRIQYSPEASLLGTGGALMPWRSFFDSTFLVVYGDNLLKADVGRLLQFHRERKASVTVALLWRDDAWHSGIADVDEDGRILRFVEKPRRTELFSRWVSAGLLVVEPEVIDRIPADGASDFGRDLLPRWIAENRGVFGYKLLAEETPLWIDTPEDLARVYGLQEKGTP
jgi:NDP-sugar pyrophosphorylase family protein